MLGREGGIASTDDAQRCGTQTTLRTWKRFMLRIENGIDHLSLIGITMTSKRRVPRMPRTELDVYWQIEQDLCQDPK
jgi:hypothetical protein